MKMIICEGIREISSYEIKREKQIYNLLIDRWEGRQVRLPLLTWYHQSYSGVGIQPVNTRKDNSLLGQENIIDLIYFIQKEVIFMKHSLDRNTWLPNFVMMIVIILENIKSRRYQWSTIEVTSQLLKLEVYILLGLWL